MGLRISRKPSTEPSKRSREEQYFRIYGEKEILVPLNANHLGTDPRFIKPQIMPIGAVIYIPGFFSASGDMEMIVITREFDISLGVGDITAQGFVEVTPHAQITGSLAASVGGFGITSTIQVVAFEPAVADLSVAIGQLDVEGIVITQDLDPIQVDGDVDFEISIDAAATVTPFDGVLANSEFTLETVSVLGSAEVFAHPELIASGALDFSIEVNSEAETTPFDELVVSGDLVFSIDAAGEAEVSPFTAVTANGTAAFNITLTGQTTVTPFDVLEVTASVSTGDISFVVEMDTLYEVEKIYGEDMDDVALLVEEIANSSFPAAA